MIRLLFPPKCILCEKILEKNQLYMCQDCAESVESFPKAKNTLSFLAGWSAMWYYKGNVRSGILKYKFGRRRNRGVTFGKLLAMKLLQEEHTNFDVLTWIPVSPARLRSRGYDQVELFAKSTAMELGQPLQRTLKKIRNTAAQSSLMGTDARRANVMGAYKVADPYLIRGKRILLLDDVLTTGATASECAKVLLLAGAKEVYCVALAAVNPDKKHSSR